MTLKFESCTVACFGRALVQEGGEYRPTTETARRAYEVGHFWQSPYQPTIRSIVCAGGYPKSMLHMEKPPNGISEASFQHSILQKQWKVPDSLICIEGDSHNTFLQFSNCIQQGFLQVGAYTAQHPLVFSMSTPNSWRIGLLAQAILQIPAGGMYRLKPGNDPFENATATQERERDLTVMTKLAIDIVDANKTSSPTSNVLRYIEDIYAAFTKVRKQFEGGEYGEKKVAYANFMRIHRYPWPIIEVPILNY